MTTFSEAMQYQHVKLQQYLRPAGKPIQFHELVRIWEQGGASCIGCTSTRYRDCINCDAQGYQPQE